MVRRPVPPTSSTVGPPAFLTPLTALSRLRRQSNGLQPHTLLRPNARGPCLPPNEGRTARRHCESTLPTVSGVGTGSRRGTRLPPERAWASPPRSSVISPGWSHIDSAMPDGGVRGLPHRRRRVAGPLAPTRFDRRCLRRGSKSPRRMAKFGRLIDLPRPAAAAAAVSPGAGLVDLRCARIAEAVVALSRWRSVAQRAARRRPRVGMPLYRGLPGGLLTTSPLSSGWPMCGCCCKTR